MAAGRLPSIWAVPSEAPHAKITEESFPPGDNAGVTTAAVCASILVRHEKSEDKTEQKDSRQSRPAHYGRRASLAGDHVTRVNGPSTGQPTGRAPARRQPQRGNA